MTPAIGVVIKREHMGVELRDEIHLGTLYKVDLESVEQGVWKNMQTGEQKPGANIMARNNDGSGTWGRMPLEFLNLIIPKEGCDLGTERRDRP